MSPLGKYSDIIASITALMLVAAAIAVHLNFIGNVADTSWLDASAGAAIGLILGQRVTTNGAAKVAAAANTRLDKIGAPPADDGHTNSTPGE